MLDHNNGHGEHGGFVLHCVHGMMSRLEFCTLMRTLIKPLYFGMQTELSDEVRRLLQYVQELRLAEGSTMDFHKQHAIHHWSATL